jgi:hypothetical protein
MRNAVFLPTFNPYRNKKRTNNLFVDCYIFYIPPYGLLPVVIGRKKRTTSPYPLCIKVCLFFVNLVSCTVNFSHCSIHRLAFVLFKKAPFAATYRIKSIVLIFTCLTGHKVPADFFLPTGTFNNRIMSVIFYNHYKFHFNF